MYEKLIHMLPMTYEKWCNLTNREKEDYRDLNEYISDHIERVNYCLRLLDILEDVAKQQQGYKRAKTEILVKKYIEVFNIKGIKGLYKQIDALRWKLKFTVCLFNWEYENIVKTMQNDLFNVY